VGGSGESRGCRGRTGVRGRGSRGESIPRARRLAGALGPVAVALIALWLYRGALGLAYFNDDPTGHFAWMEGRSVVDFFTGSAAYGYYRPVVFTALRLFERLFGSVAWPHNPVADHALLLLLHAANTALVWRLARALARPSGRGGAAFAWLAALLFATLPFSYEAVAYVASLTHPLVVFWVLVTLHLYLRRPTAGRRPPTADDRPPTTDHGPQTTGHWLLTTDLLPTDLLSTAPWPLSTALLALLTHENGLLVLPALLGVDWLRRPGDSAGDRLRRLWPVGALAALYVVVWLAIPKNSGQGLNAPAGIAANAVPFLQTLVFPLLPALRLDAGDVAALVVAAVGLLAVLGLAAWRAGAARLWVFALGWTVLAALPSLLFLDPAYVYGSPRLSYLPAVGVGLLWGLPLLWLRRLRAGGAALAALTGVVALALLWPARPFVACQLDFYADTSRTARQMGAIGASAPAGRELLFVNAPFFFSSTAEHPDGCPSAYPWTPTGGILIPPYAQPRDFVRFNGGPDRAATGVTFAGYAPGWRTFGPEIDGDGLRAAAGDRAAYVFDLGRGGFADLSAAWQSAAAPAAAPLATFGDALALVGASAEATEAALDVRLDWRVLAAPPFLPAVFVHVYDAGGALVAQSDGPPAGGLAPLALWRPGDRLSDARQIDLSALPPGSYAVAVGVYNPADGLRLPAVAAGARLPNDVWLLRTITR